jgi:hypothetical protein
MNESYKDMNLQITQEAVKQQTDDEIQARLRGLRDKLKAERVDELIEARKQLADQSNPYPHKLRD